MEKKYILDGKTPVAVGLLEWARWLETADRKVAVDNIAGSEVSTVFMELYHQFGDGPPLFFETRVFGGPLDGEQERYSTWEAAEAGHKEMVDKLQKVVSK